MRIPDKILSLKRFIWQGWHGGVAPRPCFECTGFFLRARKRRAYAVAAFQITLYRFFDNFKRRAMLFLRCGLNLCQQCGRKGKRSAVIALFH